MLCCFAKVIWNQGSIITIVDISKPRYIRVSTLIGFLNICYTSIGLVIEWRCFVSWKYYLNPGGLISIVAISKPRYVRVNTLKLDSKLALQELGKQNKVLSAHCMISLFCLLCRHYVQLCFPSGMIFNRIEPITNANFCLRWSFIVWGNGVLMIQA